VLAALFVPGLDGAVLAYGGQPGAVVQENQVENQVGMPFERLQKFAVGDVPDLDGFAAAHRQSPAVRTEDQALLVQSLSFFPVRMNEQRDGFLAGGRIPNLGGAVLAV